MTEFEILIASLLVAGWLYRRVFAKGPRRDVREVRGREVELFEEAHNSEVFIVLQVGQPGLPGALVVERAQTQDVIARSAGSLAGSPEDPAEAVGDPDFAVRVRVGGLCNADAVALFDAESRRAVAEVVGHDARLRDGTWRLSRKKRGSDMQPHVERMARVSERLTDIWARVVDGRDAVLLERLTSDPAPGHRRACLEVLLDAPEATRRAAIEAARADPDINVRAGVAAVDGAAGLPLSIEAIEDEIHASTRTRVQALRALGEAADEATRAACVRRLLERGPAHAEAAVVGAALAIDPSAEPPPADALAPWLSPATSEAAQRAHLMRWFARFGPDGRARVLAALASERQPEVVAAAADALALVGTPADIERLGALRPGALDFSGPTRALREAIDRAIEAIEGRQIGAAGALSLAAADGQLSLAAPETPRD